MSVDPAVSARWRVPQGSPAWRWRWCSAAGCTKSTRQKLEEKGEVEPPPSGALPYGDVQNRRDKTRQTNDRGQFVGRTAGGTKGARPPPENIPAKGRGPPARSELGFETERHRDLLSGVRAGNRLEVDRPPALVSAGARAADPIQYADFAVWQPATTCAEVQDIAIPPYSGRWLNSSPAGNFPGRRSFSRNAPDNFDYRDLLGYNRLRRARKGQMKGIEEEDC